MVGVGKGLPHPGLKLVLRFELNPSTIHRTSALKVRKRVNVTDRVRYRGKDRATCPWILRQCFSFKNRSARQIAQATVEPGGWSKGVGLGLRVRVKG